MWYTLYVRCFCDASTRQVGLFFNEPTSFISFNYCDFSNKQSHCSACKAFCESFIRDHPGCPRQKGTISHPLSF